MKSNLSKSFSPYLNRLSQQPLSTAVLIGLLPAMLIFYIGYTFLISGMWEENDARAAAVLVKEAENRKAKAVEDEMPAFKAEFVRVVALVAETEPLLPKESDIFSVLEGVQAAADKHNVILTGLNANKPAIKSPNADKLYEKEVPAIVTGKYEDVLGFFDDVSSLQRIMVIRDFDSASAKSKSNPNAPPDKVSTLFSLLTFNAPPASEYPAVPSDMKPAMKAAN